MHSSLNESTTHIVSGIWKEILLTQNDILIESDTFELIFKKILIESTKSGLKNLIKILNIFIF